MCYSLILLMEH